MRTRLTLLVCLAAIAPSTLVSAQGAGTAPTLAGLTVGSPGTSGGPLHVSGTMTVAPQPMVAVWNDATLDFGLNNYPADPNTDLVQGSVQRARPGDPVTLQIKVAPVAVDLAPKPFQWHRWAFQLEERWYFIEFTYVLNNSAFEWRGSWYYCKLALGSNCIHGTTPPFPVTWDGAARTLTGRIPLADLAAVQPDGQLRQDSMRHFNDQYTPEAGYKNTLQVALDRSVAMTAYPLPIETVSLSVARVGGDPVPAGYADLAPTADPLSFSIAGTVATDGLEPGSYYLFVEGCFGPCTTQAVPFTIA